MSTKLQQRLSATSLALLAVAFVAAVMLSNQLFSGWKLDLTEDRLYTLSDGTKRILGKIEEPINLYFYYSDQATAGIPSLRSYAERVREMLEEFEDEAGGMIRLSVIDPLPFSEDEDRAAQFGLQSVQLSATPDPVYMGLAGTDSVDNEAIIPFFQPDKEEFLEYDIAKLVTSLAQPERIVIGLVSGLELSGGFDMETQRMRQPWVVYDQASQLFDIRDLGTSFDEVDEDVSLLWIVQPRDLSTETQYAIDQFILRGGKALIMVDPMADVDPASGPGMPQGMPPIGQGSNLPTLFEAWGIGFSEGQVVADAQLALPITTGMSRRPVRHYGYLGVGAERMSEDDIVTADLSVVNLATAGSFALAEGSAATLEPLLTSSEFAAQIAASRFSFLPDPAQLQDGFSPSGENYVLVARLSGMLKSAFPGGRPAAGIDTAEPNEDGQAAESAAGDSPSHLAESTEPANVILVGDVDMLDDRLWVQVQSFFGQQIANAFASNGALVVNALENLSGSSDLIGVRSRASFSRPFTTVDQLRIDAEARFRETEQRLQDELNETESRLRELQSSREDGDLLLSTEQQTEIERFIDQRAGIRRELRAVQRNLDRDIERLGTMLKVINIGLVPLLLTVFVLVAVWRRNRGSAA
ncbi:MAG: Gldg family protein [Gammaproteobacteria bacterium]|nr:Gldg family protein [Gammaproteobacteria bacterium]MDH4254628.1 Gldg family protein [Gammaproteobacteria bacterium]MDH5309456.1 Gldg family protein [Gammaproteobacteria bacterium]